MKISGNGIELSRISLPRLMWLLLGLVMFWHLLYVECRQENRDVIIMSDGAGYYAYLPAAFIYHDYEYKFTQPGPEKVDFKAADHTLFMNRTSDGKLINKYFIGTAFMEMPFFLVAYATAPLFGYHMNGYSFPFQIAIALAAIFYTLLGLDQLRRILSKKGISEPIQALTMLLVFLGTNLYQYTLNEPSMSHAYSFCMVALFVNQAHNVFHEQNRKSIMWTILALTMVIFLRPVNGVVVFALPFIAGSWDKFTEGLRFTFSQMKMVLFGVAGFAFMLFIQLLMYKKGVGKWVADSYSGETLDLTNVHFANVLFSFRKGWFVYTPLMLFAVAGIFLLRSSFERITFTLFLLINIWVIASWQCWPYGGSFGMRPFIDTYVIMCIPLAFLLQRVFTKWIAIVAFPVAAFIVVLNLVQVYQYKWGILAYDEMTWPFYKKIFMKTDLAYSCLYQPGSVHDHTLPAGSTLRTSASVSFEPDSNGTLLRGVTSDNAFSGRYSMRLDTAYMNEIVHIPVDSFVPPELRAKTWIVVKAKIFLTSDNMNARMGMSFRSGGVEYRAENPPFFGYMDTYGSWQDFYYPVKLPLPPQGDIELVCFLLHNGTTVTYADDLIVEFWTEP